MILCTVDHIKSEICEFVGGQLVGGWQPGNDTENNSLHSANLMVSASTDSQELFFFFPPARLHNQLYAPAKSNLICTFFFRQQTREEVFSRIAFGGLEGKIGKSFVFWLSVWCNMLPFVSRFVKKLVLSVHWVSARYVNGLHREFSLRNSREISQFLSPSREKRN